MEKLADDLLLGLQFIELHVLMTGCENKEKF